VDGKRKFIGSEDGRAAVKKKQQQGYPSSDDSCLGLFCFLLAVKYSFKSLRETDEASYGFSVFHKD